MSKRRDRRNKRRKGKPWYTYARIIPTRKVQEECRKMKEALKPFGGTKQMVASNEFFKEINSVWKQTTPTTWSCQSADYPLEWMKSKPVESVKNELIRRGFTWVWK